MRFLIAFLVASSVAIAAPPKLSITANRSAAVGSGVTVNVDEPVTIELSTDADAKLAVFVVPKIHFDSTTDGRKVIFFAKQSVVFLVAAFNPGGEITKSEYTVTVSGTPVPIPPGPVPPGPTPPGPDIPTSPLGKAAYQLGIGCKSPTRMEDLPLIIEALTKFRPQVAASMISDKTLLSKAIADGNLSKGSKGGLDNPKAIAAGILTAMIMAPKSTEAKVAWAKDIPAYIAVPLSSAIKDKDTGLKAIDDLIAGFKAVKQ